MKKKYVAPEMEVIDIEMSNILSASEIKEGGDLREAGAPGLMSFDDVDDFDDTYEE